MRRSGAQWLSWAGVELSVVQLYGRWGSDAVRKYVEEITLERACEELTEKSARVNLAAPAEVSNEAADEPVANGAPVYVMNLTSGVAHFVRISPFVTPLERWRTVCGRFKFGREGAYYEVTRTRPADEAICAKCRIEVEWRPPGPKYAQGASGRLGLLARSTLQRSWGASRCASRNLGHSPGL